jgi:hypothetical protein
MGEKSGRIILLVAYLTMMPMSRRHVDSISENELMKTGKKAASLLRAIRNLNWQQKVSIAFVSLHVTCFLPLFSFCLSSFFVFVPFLVSFLFYFRFLFLLYILHSSFLSLSVFLFLLSVFVFLYVSFFISLFIFSFFFCLPFSLSFLLAVFITFCYSLFFSLFLSVFISFFRGQITHRSSFRKYLFLF